MRVRATEHTHPALPTPARVAGLVLALACLTGPGVAPAAAATTPAAAGPARTAASATGHPARPHLTWTTRTLSASGRALSYEVVVPVFAGSPVAEDVNVRVRAAAGAAIAHARREVRPGDPHRTLSGTGTVTTDDGRTAQVRFDFTDYLDGTAHPVDSVRTVVVDLADGLPVTLAGVFPREHAALVRLARAVRRLAAAGGEPITAPGGLAPQPRNWASWQTTTRGMAVSFQDYQLGGHGTRTYVVPWTVVRPLMSPRSRRLLAPGR